jgi:hypothetical protein
MTSNGVKPCRERVMNRFLQVKQILDTGFNMVRALRGQAPFGLDIGTPG